MWVAPSYRWSRGSEHWEAALALFGGMENLRANHVVYNGVLRLVTVGVLHNKRPEPARTRGEVNIMN